ncbi:hypothetical protein O181_092177 [Austropuccinia psidii MF-1]|uniref:Uncharacterized protein n=1 Tax=Austropuccinia psidii MF-1 TaxID=1389203 RepID=A0A9Q3IYN1_9BASI|nr:hypothetical protein [Austropuccinia psidii MF-1]
MTYLGHLGPLQLLWSSYCGLWYQLGPFWPNSNGDKRGQGDRLAAPPEAVFGQNFKRSKMAKSNKNLKLAQGPKIPKFSQGLKAQAMASGNHQRTPATFNQGVPPQDQGNPWPNSNAPKSVRTRSGTCMVLYTIMHHLSS